MEKALLKEIILEQKHSLEHADSGITREILSRVADYARLPHAVVISGIRRSGKSTLLVQIMNRLYGRDGIYYLNFEDERLINFEVSDFTRLHEVFIESFGEKKVFFFDEIQNVEKWEVFVRRQQENGHKFFITGSNASLLSRELGTRLTGRNMPVELFPFSFREFLSFRGYGFTRSHLSLSPERGKIKGYFNEYLEHGGMPEYLKYGEPVVLKRVYDDILYRDIITRHEIKESKALRELGLFLMTNVGALFSFNKLKGFLGLGSSNTVKSYAGFFEDAFLLFTVNGFSYSLKQQVLNPKKVYCIDNGLNNAISFRFSKDRGKFLENQVCIELKRKGFEIYYYRTRSGKEVDFVVREGNEIRKMIQVCYDFDGKTCRRETGALYEAMDELRMPEAMILTDDTETEMKSGSKTIAVKPVYRWLLEDEERND